LNVGDDAALINSGKIRRNRHMRDAFQGLYILVDTRMAVTVGTGAEANYYLNADGVTVSTSVVNRQNG
jgi:hypothetical protein